MIQNAPRVSVITSTYNWPRALELAATTVLSQTYQDLEYIIVGDHCTDTTEAIVAGWQDPRIRWFNLESHQGNQSNVNRYALTQARGDLIAYLNHDDLWLPNHLQNLVALFDADPDLAIANSLCLEISPPPYLYRSVIGLPWQQFVIVPNSDCKAGHRPNPVRRLSQRIQRKLRRAPSAPTPSEPRQIVYMNTPMTSTIMHRAAAGIAAGGWQDWRETHEIPTQDFFRRLKELPGGFAVLGKVTALKFHSGDRKQSYRLGKADEQAQALAQIQSDPHWLADQLAVAGICDSLSLQPPKLPQPPRPADPPFGWQIEQWRRMRGLPALIDLGASEPDETLMQLPPPTPLLRSCQGVTCFWRPAPGPTVVENAGKDHPDPQIRG